MANGENEERAWFEALFLGSYDRVFTYALARSDPEAAKDVTAKTFLVAWRRRREIPGRELPWLIGVARKTLADERRARARRTGLDERLLADRGMGAATADLAEEVAERAVVLAALKDLRPDDREILTLVAWDGLAAADAAESLGCSRSAFAVRLLRARRRLAAAMARHDQRERDERVTGSIDPEPAVRRTT